MGRLPGWFSLSRPSLHWTRRVIWKGPLEIIKIVNYEVLKKKIYHFYSFKLNPKTTLISL